MRMNCPICKAVTTWEENPHRPFCSERCKMHDLGNWVTGKYRVEGEEASSDVSADVSADEEANHDE